MIEAITPDRGCRLLVVDDEAIVGKRLQQVFGKMGFVVETHTDPASALEAMAERPFDIVVTDLKMEGIDGMEVLSRVKGINPEARVIIITGYAQSETEDDTLPRVSSILSPNLFVLMS